MTKKIDSEALANAPHLDDKIIRKYHDLVLKRISTPTLRKPTFLGIGEGRCGTTSISAWLSNHPDVYMSPVKEIKFFSQTAKFVHENGISFNDYLNYFLFAGEQKHVGEISPQYINSTETLKRIHKLLPDVKIIITIRNPVDRFYSLYKYHKNFHGYDNIENYVSDGFKYLEKKERPFHCPSRNLLRSLYAEKIGAAFELFGKKNVLILALEELMESPDVYKERLLNFLDIKDAGLSFPTTNRTTSEKFPEEITKMLWSRLYADDVAKLEKLGLKFPAGFSRQS